MERIPKGRYTKEFREEAVKMVTDGSLSSLEVSRRLSLPKSTLERWIRVSKEGNLGQLGKGQRPLTELEQELARVKRELSLAKMERDILKKRPRTLPKSRCTLRGDQGDATDLSCFVVVPRVGSDSERVLCLDQASVFHPTEGRGKTGVGDMCCS